MKYKELIQFEPLETVVQLKWANNAQTARNLVTTFVISDAIADRLIRLALPNLQFDKPADNKGLFVVGNYGTGKSHLMSVLSSVCEEASLVPLLKNVKIIEQVASVAGRFRVVRQEIGATDMPLREIILGWLEEFLSSEGIDFTFPTAIKTPGSKDELVKMMGLVQRKYPNQGLMLVVDELFDYLCFRAKHESDLMRDLTFLKELGEVCANSRFRVVAGVQESLFDNPRFAFVSSSILRVQERFEQLLIQREDIGYVVAERLLKKNTDQLTKIREHLLPFTRYYRDMNEKLDDFCRLFPIHPDYIDMLERLRLVEKRAILRTLSLAMTRIIDEEVPKDQPGLLSYDNYWQTLADNPAYHTSEEVRAVVEVYHTIAGKIKLSKEVRNRAFASRIVRALCIDRLAVGDLKSRVGLTAEALRDSLCLFDPLVAEMGGEHPEEDLRGTVETSFRQIRIATNGQFFTEENNQYFIDITRVTDFDLEVEKRADILEPEALDRAYYNALRQVMEVADSTYIPHYRIWEHELEWLERKSARSGYLFFGAPNERSTAVPPRDFYLYFLQMFDLPTYHYEKRADEVFFGLKKDTEVEQILRKYAAAHDLVGTSSGANREKYREFEGVYLRQLNKWLRDHFPQAYEVIHLGQSKQPLEWLKGSSITLAGANFRDLVNNISSVCLAAQFAEDSPDYPRFSALITSTNRSQAAQEALRTIGAAGHSTSATMTRQGRAVLDALELLDGERLDPARSRYSQYILDKLNAKPKGQVLNRAELIESVQGVDYLAPQTMRLEPEWVVVVLAALAYNGSLVIALPGQKFDSANLDRLASVPMESLCKFKHLEQPKEVSLVAVQALFELFGLPPGNAQLVVEQGKEEPLQTLMTKVSETLEQVVRAKQDTLLRGLVFWNCTLFTEIDLSRWQEPLRLLQEFLEDLSKFNTPGKLHNYTVEVSAIRQQSEHLRVLKEVQGLETLLNDLSPLSTYLAGAEAALPEEDPLTQEIRLARDEIRVALTNAERRTASSFRADVRQRMEKLKRKFLVRYIEWHSRARLGQKEDKRKMGLIQDPRLRVLQTLATISILPVSQLKAWQEELGRLVPCFTLTEEELQASPICPHCHFKPGSVPALPPAAGSLSALDERLDAMLLQWTATLRQNLEDPVLKQALGLLKPEEKRAVEDFLRNSILPDPLSAEFVEGVRQVLEGLVKITVTLEDLRNALLSGGSPATPAEMRKRFEEYLDGLTKGKEPGKVRIVLE